jgi:hypothetical protein
LSLINKTSLTRTLHFFIIFGCMEHELSNLYGAFSIEFKMKGDPWLLLIIPEMAPAKVGLKALGSYYYIYCVHPERGSMTFIIEQDEQDEWISERLPPFIDPVLVTWIGDQIEEQNRAE